MVEVFVDSVRINLTTGQRVVILKDSQQERYLFIWIANAEAYSIAVALQGSGSARPLPHDLLKTVIGELNGNVTRVVVNDLVEGTFYARIILDASGRHIEIDSRSSDAIALAVRLTCPIFVEDAVMDEAAIVLDTDDKEDGDEEHGDDTLGVFRDFINSLESLDDFGRHD